MRIYIICFILSFLIFSTTIFGQSPNYDYQTTYLMETNLKGIRINGALIQTDSACLEENGVVMVPLLTFLSFARFSTLNDYETEQFQADIDGFLFYVDGVNDKIGFEDYQYSALVPPLFINEECYVSFQDLSGLMSYDSTNGLISMSVGNDFIERIENHCREMQQSEIYVFPANESTIYKGKQPIHFNERTYIQNDYMMIPLRDTIQALYKNSEIQWNKEKNLVQAQLNEKYLTLDTVNQKFFINGEEVYLEQNTEMINNHFFISLRGFAKILGLYDTAIYWNEEVKSAYVRIIM